VICEKPAPFGKTHPICVTRNCVDGSISALTYKDKNVKRIIEVFKYNFVSDLAAPLAELIVETINKQNLENYFQDFVLVPIPLHPRRKNWRGFNQAGLLSMELSKLLNIKIEDKLVSRVKYTKPQVNLGSDDRKKNMLGAFALNGIGFNKKIILVDDVITTGSTANELAKILKRAGAEEIWVLTAALG